MASNPNKSIEKYIEQGTLILRTDENAQKCGDSWKLVTTMRGVLHTRLGQLKTKTLKLEELSNDLACKVEEKNIIMGRMRSQLQELTVFVENAFFFDDADILKELNLEEGIPSDEKNFYYFVDSFIRKLNSHDFKRFPIPDEMVCNVCENHEPLRSLIKECNTLRQVRKQLVEDRTKSLDEFREVLKPIRKWLWKMLPEGRSDKRLHDYGFKPYGK